MNSRLGVYVINLDRAPERRVFMESETARAGLDATFVSAIDAKAQDFAPRGGLMIRRDDVLIETNWDGRIYVQGEEACFQSHLKALRLFLESPHDVALVLEDDAEFAPDFPQALEAILGYRRLWDIVKLEGTRMKGARPALKVAEAGPYRLVASLNPSSGAAAYLATRAAAERLLAQAGGIFEPFDNYLSAHWRHGLKVLDCAPFPARQGLPVSTRKEKRGPSPRQAGERFTAWRRHLGADFFRRYVLRWFSQRRRFAGHTHGFTLAPWARDWSG